MQERQDGEGNPFLVKKKPQQINRSIAMLREFCCQRKTIAFGLLIVGVTLVAVGLCFSPSFDKDANGLVLYGENDSKKESKQQPKKKIESKSEHPKTSIKKQIFTAVITDQNTVNNIPFVVRAWASDFMKSRFSGGFHFVSEIPISLYTIPVKVVSTAYLRTPKIKEFWKIWESICDYNQNSRALWYLAVSNSVFINSSLIEQFTDLLSRENDPMKKELVKIETLGENFAILMSRAAVKKLVKNEYTIDRIEEFIDAVMKLSSAMDNGMVVSGAVDDTTVAALSKYEFSQCSSAGVSNHNVFLWIFETNDPSVFPNMKQLPECKVVNEKSKLHFCY